MVKAFPLYREHFLQNPFQFINHLTTLCYVYSQDTGSTVKQPTKRRCLGACVKPSNITIRDHIVMLPSVNITR
jgi:hypothetical protein